LTWLANSYFFFEFKSCRPLLCQGPTWQSPASPVSAPVAHHLHKHYPRALLPATPCRSTAALAPTPLPTPRRRVAPPIDRPPTPPCPLKGAPHHRCTSFPPSQLSPSSATRAHPFLSLLGLMSALSDRTAAACTVFASPCCHFAPYSVLDPCAPFSLDRVVPHFPPPLHLAAGPTRGCHRSPEHHHRGERRPPKHLLRPTDTGKPQ
jgi:hypothetical protein